MVRFIEQRSAHALLCGEAARGTSGVVTLPVVLGRAGRLMLDFALPPRCAGCGAITAEVDLFCDQCWPQIDFLSGGCQRCGQPLEATEADTCGACHADQGALDRMRAAVAYGDAARSIAIRLKYGRKTGLARTMAAYMRRPLGELTPGALLVPVPLRRGRLSERGFNQSALIAAGLARTAGVQADAGLLQRTRRTPKLKGMSPSERRRVVFGAFAVRPGREVKGRAIVLVDDVFTTGSTAEACARLLKRKGAASVELLAWARVVRPTVVNRRTVPT
jgi:ComF family protein